MEAGPNFEDDSSAGMASTAGASFPPPVPPVPPQPTTPLSIIAAYLRRGVIEDFIVTLRFLKYCLVETYLGDFLLQVTCSVTFLVLCVRYIIPATRRIIWPPTADELYLEGIAILKKDEDNHSRAMRKFRSCLRKDANFGWAYVALAREELRRDEFQRCIDTANMGLDRMLSTSTTGVDHDEARAKDASSAPNAKQNEVVNQLETLRTEADALRRFGARGSFARQVNVGNFDGLGGCRASRLT